VEVEISDDHVQTQEINSCPGRREHSRRAWQPSQLQHLEQPFSEEEIMVNSDDVQRKDRFYWTFFSICWQMIMAAIHHFFSLNSQGFTSSTMPMWSLFSKRKILIK
jgi:hypothetical protein